MAGANGEGEPGETMLDDHMHPSNHTDGYCANDHHSIYGKQYPQEKENKVLTALSCGLEQRHQDHHSGLQQRLLQTMSQRRRRRRPPDHP